MDIYKTLELDGYKVRYFDAGRGEPIVFLHGFCLSSVEFELIVPSLAKEFRVIGPDLPGFGGSDIVPGMHDLRRMATWLDRFVSKLEMDTFILIGHSMGGYLSLAYAEDYAERLKAIGLFHSTAAADDEIKKESRNKAIEFVEKAGVKPFVTNFVKTILYADNPDLENRILEIAMETSPEAVISWSRAMRDRPDRQHLLREMDIPILFLMGRHDPRLPLFKLRDEIMLPKNAIKSLLEFAGHMGMYESPTAARAALRNFFKYAITGAALQ